MQGRFQFGAQLDVRADEAGKHRAQVADEGVEIEHARRQQLLATEGEKLAGQGGRPVGGLLHFHYLGVVRVVLLQTEEEQFGVAGDDAQQVVEIVGDATGQPAHRLHLLRLPQIRLQADAAR